MVELGNEGGQIMARQEPYGRILNCIVIRPHLLKELGRLDEDPMTNIVTAEDKELILDRLSKRHDGNDAKGRGDVGVDVERSEGLCRRSDYRHSPA